MLAVCVDNSPAALADHQRGRFTEVNDPYPLTPGKKYPLIGLGIWETILYALVEDDHGLPMWCPIGLFEIGPQTLPAHWSFTLAEGIRASGRQLWTRWVARWGYDELVRDEGHSDGLMNRDPQALRIFEREAAQARKRNQ